MGLSLIAARYRGGLPGLGYVLFAAIFLIGWWLREGSVRTFWQRIRTHWALIAMFLYSQIFLIATLASIDRSPPFLWFSIPLLLLSLAGLLWLRRKIPPIFWIASGALVLFVLHIDAWWFAVVGDEYSFYRAAEEIVEKGMLSSMSDSLFRGDVVYGTHPYISSLIQAFFMRILGDNNFGWRFSNLYLSSASIALIYYFFRPFLKRRVALLAALFLAVSHYLMSFGKIGYNNLQALFALALVLFTAQWALRRGSMFAYALLGLTTGFCFYVYPAALFVIPLPFLLLLLFSPPTNRRRLGRWAVAFFSLGLSVLPLAWQETYWTSKLAGTFLNDPLLTESATRLGSHIGSNFMYSFLSALFIPDETHFVAASFLDPLSSVFFLIGFSLLLTRFWKGRFRIFLVISFLYLLLLVGATHDRPFPTSTRMFLILPWFTLFAACGFAYFLDAVHKMTKAPFANRALCLLIPLSIVTLNLLQAYSLSKVRLGDRYQSPQVLLLREVKTSLNTAKTRSSTLVLINTPETYIRGSLLELFRLYGVDFASDRLVEIDSSRRTLPFEIYAQIVEGGSLVAPLPWVEGTTVDRFEKILRASGKAPCGVRNSNGERRLDLWYAPRFAAYCQNNTWRMP
jgi:hypothetical protein